MAAIAERKLDEIPRLFAVPQEERKVAVEAFIQLFIRRGDTIVCLSYPFYHRPQSLQQARQALLHTLSPAGGENDRYYQSGSEGLLFATKSGPVDLEATIRRFNILPGEFWATNQQERLDELRNLELLAEVERILRAGECLNIFQTRCRQVLMFSYKVIGSEVWGVGLDDKPYRMAKLAWNSSGEHRTMLEKLEASLVGMNDGMAIHLAFDGTVTSCCGDAYNLKLLNGDGDSRGGSDVTGGSGFVFAPKEEKQLPRCAACGGLLRSDEERICSRCKQQDKN